MKGQARISFGALLFALVVLVGACDWALPFGNPQGTAFNPDSGISTANVARLGIPWAVGGHPASSLAESRGIVVQGNTAHNTSDGSVRWTSNVLSPSFGVAIGGGTVYGTSSASHGYTLYALSLDTGAVLWSATRPDGGVASAPVVAGGRVYVVAVFGFGGGSAIESFDATTHQFVRSQSFATGGFAPTFANGVEYAAGEYVGAGGQLGERLWAFDAATGAVLWSTAANHCNTTLPMVAGGKVYASGSTFDATTGAFLWNWPVCAADSALHSTAVAADTVFVLKQFLGAIPPQVVAFDATTGATKWTASVGPVELIVGNNVVFTSDLNTLRGLDAATGAKVWTPTPVAGIFSPIVGDGSLYAQTSTALIAYRPTS